MLEVSDIVKIISLNKEGMITSIALDLETNKTKYCVVDCEKNYYLVTTNDIIKIDTLDNRVNEYFEEEQAHFNKA